MIDKTTIIIILISIGIGILGLVLDRSDINKRVKFFLWLVFLILLGANPLINEYQASSSQATISAIKSDEDAVIGTTQEILMITSSTQQTMAILAADQNQSSTQGGNATKNLKLATTALSSQIIQFLNQRNSEENLLEMQNGFSPDFANEELSFEQDTMNMYNSQFSVQVIATTEALAQKGLTSLELRELYQDPVNEIGISEVAQQLGVLAQQLP